MWVDAAAAYRQWHPRRGAENTPLICMYAMHHVVYWLKLPLVELVDGFASRDVVTWMAQRIDVKKE